MKYTAVGTNDREYSGTQLTSAGTVWVCRACGKRSKTRYGFDENDKNVCDPGWDESCMLNAVLCYEEKP